MRYYFHSELSPQNELSPEEILDRRLETHQSDTRYGRTWFQFQYGAIGTSEKRNPFLAISKFQFQYV